MFVVQSAAKDLLVGGQQAGPSLRSGRQVAHQSDHREEFA
jgi:hypothetical protein